MGYETTNSSRPGIKRKLKTLGLGLETENFLDVCDQPMQTPYNSSVVEFSATRSDYKVTQYRALNFYLHRLNSRF